MDISIKNVTFSYSDDIEDAVLKGVDLQIKSGECIVLAGESGCGKTTLSKLINGLIPLYQSGTMAGEIYLGDRNTADMSLAEISKYVGSVFQNPRSQFFNIDTDSEIAFGCENQGIEPAEILHRIENTVADFDMEHLLGRNIFHLSGGEKQKIACASVNATEPDIFVLDEPSANLDLPSIQELKKIISCWKAKGKTVVVVEHRIHYLMELAERICYVQGGRIAYEWTPAELKENGPEFAVGLGLRCLNLNFLAETQSEFLRGRDSDDTPSHQVVYTDLRFAYNKKFPILDIPELSLPKGRITALVGHNGAGKSTLAKVLCGKRGSYLIMQDVNHQLFTESVLDEIMLGMEPFDEKAAREILANLNLEKYAGEHPMALSGGQKQRVAIGSAISNNRDVIILDEPTSGLDYRQMLAVSAELKKLAAQGKTLFIITHDPEFILNCCEFIIQMDHGRIADQFPLQGNLKKLLAAMGAK